MGEETQREVLTLPQLVGRRVRGLRTTHGRTQEDVADAARSLGLDWTRSSVASLESEVRGLSAEELLLLPAILSRVTGLKISLEKLLSIAPTQALRLERSELTDHGIEIMVFRPDLHESRATDSLTEARPLLESEMAAARRLGLTYPVFTKLSIKLWGDVYTTERERRLYELGGDDMSPRTRQATRGHVS